MPLYITACHKLLFRKSEKNAARTNVNRNDGHQTLMYRRLGHCQVFDF